MDMPVEIFVDICYYLDPLDLRHLALTNKMFRHVLMTKEAKHIWKQALTSVVNLPQCPADINEPQYVCLMYSYECYTMGCLSYGTQVNCVYRRRLCDRCFGVQMTDVSGLHKIDKFTRYRSCQWFLDIVQDPDFWKASYDYSYRDYRSFYIDEVNNVAEKYEGLLRGPNAKEHVAEYTEQLRDRNEYRTTTGADMRSWLYRRKQARSERLRRLLSPFLYFILNLSMLNGSVKAKLENAGWNPADFPSCQEFRNLVYTDQQLTPTIWQNIEPKLVLLIQRQREERLEQERRLRLWHREQDISRLYYQTARETLVGWYTCWRLPSFTPDEQSILALPRVREILETNTDGLSTDQWPKVKDEVRTRIREHWRIILRRVLTVVETSTTSPTTDDFKAHASETEENLLAEIEDMMRKLARVSASFVCKSNTCQELHWFPGVFIHGFCMNPAADLSNLLRYCDPLDAERTQLVKRLLLDLGLDADNTTAADVKGLKNLICTRCDPNTATYLSYAQIAKHYIVLVDQAKRANLGFSDHDWLSNGASLVRQDNETQRAPIAPLRTPSQAQVIPLSEA
ncbi:hypothetical protein FRC05_001084 [Tulasnella sp. 425]|nr:hypothetical protein FRC05_001084 [Tulasnella sp. 425]